MREKIYAVTARQQGRYWVFDIPELGTTGQATKRAKVLFEATHLVALWLEVPPETVTVDVQFEE